MHPNKAANKPRLYIMTLNLFNKNKDSIDKGSNPTGLTQLFRMNSIKTLTMGLSASVGSLLMSSCSFNAVPQNGGSDYVVTQSPRQSMRQINALDCGTRQKKNEFLLGSTPGNTTQTKQKRSKRVRSSGGATWHMGPFGR